MNIFKKIANIGVDEHYSLKLKKRVRLSNSTALITSLIAFPPAIILYVLFPNNYYHIICLSFGVLEFLTFYFNNKRLHSAARIVPACVAAFCVFYFSIILGAKSNILFMNVAICFAIILSYSKDEKLYFIVFSGLPIILMLVAGLTPLGYKYSLLLTDSQYQIINIWVLINSALVTVVFSFLFVRRNTRKIDNLHEIKEKAELENTVLKFKNTELDKFVYYTSHDLKSPLASLKGLITLAQNESDTYKLKEYLFLQDKAVNKLTNFIDDLIDATKNKLGKLEYVEIDVEADIKSLFETVINSNEKNEINFSVNIQQDCKLVSDRNSFYLIVNNLISNAVRYQKSYLNTKKIAVTGYVNESEASLSFYDNGIGIEEVHIHKIFEMFYRATSTKEGSGLGLYIVKESLNKIDGSISVTSTINDSTNFSIVIPNKINVLVTEKLKQNLY